MDIIKEMVCDDIYHIIEDYLTPVVVFNIINRKEDPEFPHYGKYYTILIDANLLIYLDNINSSCINQNKASSDSIYATRDSTRIFKTIYGNDTYQIRGWYELQYDDNGLPYENENHKYEYLFNWTKKYTIYINNPRENYAIDAKSNSILHSDIIDYYSSIKKEPMFMKTGFWLL